MANITLNAQQVKEARRLAWRGWDITEVAEELDENYGPVWHAVRGKTWASITEPAPVPPGEKPVRVRVCANPMCGKRYTGPPNKGLCTACYIYEYRYGEMRDPDRLRTGGKVLIPKEQLVALYRRYRKGASVAEVAREIDVCPETLRQRFHEHGLAVRANYEANQQLTPALVEHARRRYYENGEQGVDIAEDLGVAYTTLMSALQGRTWRTVPGLPDDVIMDGDEETKCIRCEVLTSHHSGLCRFCRMEER